MLTLPVYGRLSNHSGRLTFDRLPFARPEFQWRARRAGGRAVGGQAGGRAGRQSAVPAACVGYGPLRGLLARRRRAVNAPEKDGSVLRRAWSRSSTGCVRRVRAACGHAVHADSLAGTKY